MSIFKDCDIRGVYGEELTEAVMERIGRAVALRLQGRSIVVGGDFRTHTPPLKAALIRGLTEGGAEVWTPGSCPRRSCTSPSATWRPGASAQVTASHNPPQYNGLKLMFGALPVQPEDLQALKADVDGGRGGRGAGRLRPVDTADAYRQMLKSAYTAGRADLRVVVDAGNGAMSEIAPQVLAELGMQVEPLFCAYDGRFPNRDPNPAVTAHLRQLCRRVRACRADFGVAFDGDGDRAIFVDGGGVPLTAEEAMVILIRHSVQPGDSVVYDLKCSSILPRAVEERGGCPIMERSGHAFIRRHFLQAESRLAGEVSGHYFFRELGGDDGLYALVRMASIVAQEGRPIRRLLTASGTRRSRRTCGFGRRRRRSSRRLTIWSAGPRTAERG